LDCTYKINSMNEQTNEPVKALKRIDPERPTFTANGKTYTVEGSLSIERYAELQLLEKEMAYGLTVKQLFDKVQIMWNNQNKLKFAENAVIMNDIMRGLHKVQERTPVILKICCLFINTPDEDRTTLTQDLIDTKVNDWKAEGIDIRDFFRVASSSINGFLEVYKTVSRIISAQDEAEAL
jgi:hypothetical protein